MAALLAFTPLVGTPVNVETVAGTGLPGYVDGEQARFNMPHGVVVREDGWVFVLDTFNNMVRYVVDGETRTLSGNELGFCQFGFPLGHYQDGQIQDAYFNRPMGAALDSQGRLFIADSLNHSIRLVDGEYVYTFAGGGQAGHVDGFGIEAMFYHPSDVAFGPCGSLFVADSLNHVIRKIDMYGEVSTVAGIPGLHGYTSGSVTEALFNSPMGIAVNYDGVIFVTDTGNHLVRKIEDGYVTTIAGQLIFPADIIWEYPGGEFDDEPIGGFMDGYESLFNLPTGITLLGEFIIVADTANHAIRRILPTGNVQTIAGGFEVGAVDGSQDVASFHFPRGVFVAIDSIFVADTGNNLIRVITEVQDEND